MDRALPSPRHGMTSPTPPYRRPLLTATRVVAVLGLLGFAAHTGLGLGGDAMSGFFNDWVYNGLIAMSAVWCLARAVLVRTDRGAWALVGLGLACWSTAEIVNTVYLSKLEYPPYPSVADAFWLAFYPLSYGAMILLVRGRMDEFRRSLWLDGIVAGLAVASVGAIVFLQPILNVTPDGEALEVATDLAYPLGDLLMLALVIGVFALTGWRPGRAWGFIGAGLMSMAAADSIYAYQASKGLYVEGTALDSLWPAATLLVGWAAWVPSRRQVRIHLHGWRPLVLPIAFALLAVGVLVYDHFARVSTVAIVLASATMFMVLVRTAMTFGENLTMLRNSQHEALTDALTGLGNRRALMNDLRDALEGRSAQQPRALILFDLDGFKHYNDSFGHPAGDALLARLGRSLEDVVRGLGQAYRLGGDEFCALIDSAVDHDRVIEAAAVALTEHGQGFQVAASHGVALLPREADDAAAALQIADQRLYGNKGARRRSSVGQQTRDVLLRILHEREPDLHDHHHEVADLAVAVAARLPMLPEDVDVMARAAELHDIGHLAVPDTILQKPGPLDRAERDFMEKHTLVGERILAAAPALQPVARLVRASHERWDGSGYPDGLPGEEIPLGARVIAVCDAYHAMTSDRVYQPPIDPQAALMELRRCAGTQLDPAVVAIFCEEMESGRLSEKVDFWPLPSALRDPAADPDALL
jgi:two-component system cell cycle response regulator